MVAILQDYKNSWLQVEFILSNSSKYVYCNKSREWNKKKPVYRFFCFGCAAKALFSRARLFIGPHGALISNVVFMPFGGHVFETRPRDYAKKCMHALAEVCELHFYLALGHGNKTTNLDVSVPEVVETLKLIKVKMDAEDKDVM